MAKPVVASDLDSALLERAIKAIATSRQRVADYATGLERLLAEKVRFEQLRDDYDALSRELESGVSLAQELERSAKAVAREERVAGSPPEHMLVLLKDIVAKAAPYSLDPRFHRELEADVVRWGIEAYYAA